MEKNSIFGKVIPMSNGRCPWIWLFPTSNCIIEERLKIEGGIVPDNLFELTLKILSLVKWPNDSGILPPKLLKGAEITSRDDRFPKEFGKLPVRLLL